MNNYPIVIQSFWCGDVLSDMEQLCIKSYQRHGHIFHLYAYQPPCNCPAGTVLKDATEIIPLERAFVDEFSGYVNFSNIFRYALLYQLGGWWVDMDTVCLRPFSFDAPYVFSSERHGKRCSVNTTYIKSCPHSPLMLSCLDCATKRGQECLHWGELGVSLLSREVFRHGLHRYIMPPLSFCPVDGCNANLFIEPSVDLDMCGSYALHWWNELWRRNAWDKNAAYPGSLYDKMRKLYGLIS